MPWLERQRGTGPKQIILLNGVGVIVQNPQVAISRPFSHDNPHAFERDLFAIPPSQGDLKDQLREIAGFQTFTLLAVGNPERGRRREVIGFTIVKTPTIARQVWGTHKYTCSDYCHPESEGSHISQKIPSTVRLVSDGT